MNKIIKKVFLIVKINILCFLLQNNNSDFGMPFNFVYRTRKGQYEIIKDWNSKLYQFYFSPNRYSFEITEKKCFEKEFITVKEIKKLILEQEF